MRVADDHRVDPGQLVVRGRGWEHKQPTPGTNTSIKCTSPVPRCRGAPGTFWAPWTGQATPSDWKWGPSEHSAHRFQPELWRDPARWPSGLVQILIDLVSGRSKVPLLGAHCPKSRKGKRERLRSALAIDWRSAGNRLRQPKPNEANPVLVFPRKWFNRKASTSFHKLFIEFRVVWRAERVLMTEAGDPLLAGKLWFTCLRTAHPSTFSSNHLPLYSRGCCCDLYPAAGTSEEWRRKGNARWARGCSSSCVCPDTILSLPPKIEQKKAFFKGVLKKKTDFW